MDIRKYQTVELIIKYNKKKGSQATYILHEIQNPTLVETPQSCDFYDSHMLACP